MRTNAFAASASTFSINRRFHRVPLLSALIVIASLNSWAQNITVSPDNLTFAKTLIDTTSVSKTVTVSNSGLSAQRIVIAKSGDFTGTDNCSGSVAGGGSCTAKITFAPTLVGSISGAASIYDDSHILLAFVGLTGTGGAPVTTAPTSLTFTGGTIGTTSAAKTFKITNNTTGTVTINSITTKVSDYTITTGTCLTTELAKAGSCTVTVTVTPTSAADDGAIIITDNAPNAVPQVVKLTSAATGGRTTPITLSKTSLTFKVLTGGTSASQTISVNNASASAVTLGTISASSDYAIVSNTCTGSLAAGKTCTFGITFHPTFVGTIEGSAAVAYTGNNTPQLIDLTGTSEAPLTVSPTKLTFTTQGMGTTSTAQKVTITNNSASAVTLSGVVPSGDFQIQLSGTTCSLTGGTLAAGENCTIEIQFAPTIVGSVVGALTVSNTSSPHLLLISLAGTGSATNALLKGNYAMMLNGWSGATTAASVIGSFVADGAGSISKGIIDVSDQSNSTGPISGTFTGTYSVGSNNLATIDLTYGGGLSGSDTFEAALDASDGNGHIIFYDSSNLKASGLLRKQAPSAFSTGKIKGNYAFGSVGVDNDGNRMASAGEFTADGSGNLSGELDVDEAGSVYPQVSLTSSDFAVASTGRGTATITYSTGKSEHHVFYVVSASEMLMTVVDTERPPDIMAGHVLHQSGSFTDASMKGVGVSEDEYLENGTPGASLGLFTANGAGSFTGTGDDNYGGTLSTQTESGTYSVAPNGRVTTTESGSSQPTGVFYLAGQNQGFFILYNTAVDCGVVEPQVGTNFTNASLSGNYMGGSQQPESANVSEDVAYVNAKGVSPTGTVGITAHENGSGGPFPLSGSGTYVVSSNGRAVLTRGFGTGAILYIISPSQAVVLPSDNHPKLRDFHQ